MKVLLGLLVFSAAVLAQNPSVQVQNVNTAPSGACSGSRIAYLTPNGTVYTCQNGTWAALAGGGGGTGTVTSVTVAGTTNQITATGTCTGTTSITCTLSIPSGFVLPGTIDGLTITTTTGTLTVANGKTLTVSKTLRLDGTDGTVLTFPATSATIARTDAAQTFTGTQTFGSTIAGSVNGNAATATALAADPADCSSGQYANAIAANGDLTCAQVAYSQISGTPTAGATTALDNLASVNINTSLLAQTGVDAGSTTKPFRDLFLFGSGTYGTTYHRITGTPTSTRVWTLPDSTDTFVGLAATQTLTNKTLTTPAITTSSTLSNNGIGAVSTDGSIIQNTTAAAVGAQQWSPRLHFIGQGWKTTATAASQTLDWIIENQPIQWTTNPVNNLVISGQTNAGGYNPGLIVRSDGTGTGSGDYTVILNSGSNIRGIFTQSGAVCQGVVAPTTNINSASACDGGSMILNGFKLRNTYLYGWSSTTDPNVALDTAIQRDAAGVVGVVNGTQGTTTANYRDLKLRNNVLVGTTTSYNNVATAGIGTPPVYASVTSTGNTASIGTTNLQCGGAVCPSGMYRVKGYEVVTTTGTGTISTTIGWNDGTAARTSATSGVATTGTNFEAVDVVMRADGTNNITYATTLSVSGTYSLYLTLERLQ